MPITVSCPGCDHEFNVAEHHAGKTIRCKECGDTFTVKRSASTRRSTNSVSSPRRRERDEEWDDDRSSRRRREEPEGGGKKWLLIGGGGAAAALIAVVLIIVLAGGGKEKENEDEKKPDPVVEAPPTKDGKPPSQQPGPEMVGKLPGQTPDTPPEKPPEKPPEPRLALWTAQPDPAPVAIKAPTKLAAIPFATNFTTFHFPSTPSPFVFVHHGAPADNAFQVIDLRTAQPIASGSLKVRLDHVTLSPDGKILAVLDGKFEKETALRFLSLADGTQLSSFGIRAPQHGFAMDFVGSDHLLTIAGEDCQVWNIRTGKQTASYQLDERHFANCRSPGRKYHACLSPKKRILQIRDALTGKMAGEIKLPPADKEGEVEPRNLAFSPDGEELACLARWGLAEKRYRLLTWKMSTGELLTDHTLRSTGPGHFLAHSHDAGGLQWLPDRSGWIIAGRSWIDAESGELIYEIPTHFTRLTSLHRLVGKDHMTVVLERTIRPGQTSKELHVLPLPAQQIAAGIARVRNPNTMPTLKPADLASAKTLKAEGPDVKLALTADPPPVATAKLGPQPLRLPAATENVADLLFSGADVGQVVVLSATPINELSTTRRVRADRLDLATGRLLGGMDLFTGRKLEPPKQESATAPPPVGGIGPLTGAVSPDGAKVIVRQSGKPGRLDLWDLKTSKHLAGWLPCGDEKTSVEWFAFLDAGRVLTAGGNKLTLWKMPQCQAEYIVEGVPRGAALSPGRRYVAFATQRKLVMLDAANGECVGRLTPPGGEARPSPAPLFRYDGAHLAAAFSQDGTAKYGIWDLEKGSLLSSLDTRESAPPFFVGSHNLLIGAHLLQGNLDRPLCEYSFQEVQLLARNSPDDRLWWLRTGVYGAELVGLSPIHPQLSGLTPAIAARDVKRIPEPGQPIQVSVFANSGDTSKLVQDAAERRLRALGYPVGRGGLTFRIDVNSYNSGKFVNYQFEQIGTGQKNSRAVPAVVADCQITLLDTSNTTLFQTKATVGPPSSFSTTGDEMSGLFRALGADIQIWAQRKMTVPENLYRIGGRPVGLPLQLPLAMGR